MKPREGDTIFWVNGDKSPDFSNLCCDLVFVVQEKKYWENANSISQKSDIVDSREAYIDHYQWAESQHYFKRRRRFTLKADPIRSFQPQNHDGSLIDIVPFLSTVNLPINIIRENFRGNRCTKPITLNEYIVSALYQWLCDKASIKLNGKELERVRKQYPELSSPMFEEKSSKGKCC